MDVTAHRGAILHFLDNPNSATDTNQAYQYFEDGLLVVKEGRIHSVGSAVTQLDMLQKQKDFDWKRVEVIEHAHSLILPGLIDTHIHYPQAEMICSYGEQLLTWLQQYTFPTERKYGDKDYALARAHEVLDLLLSHGTTTALFFCTVHPESVDALFEAADQRNMRVIAGKVMMDRNAPQALLDQSAEESYQQSKALIERWHGKRRLSYAVTPRFAPTSSDDQLALAGKLLQEHPTVYFQTHLSENLDEIKWVKSLFPDSKGYLDVYDQHKLLSERSVFAHCIHLQESEWKRLGESGSAIAYCPSSNLFLGSGLFDLQRAERENVKVSVGTDVGAGSGFSILNTLLRGYETQQMRKVSGVDAVNEKTQCEGLTAFKALYMATLGGARALKLDDKIGNFEVGKEADFIVLDLAKPKVLDMRRKNSQSLHDLLFAVCALSDVSTVSSTYILGKRA